jgi:hypothetical protein
VRRSGGYPLGEGLAVEVTDWKVIGIMEWRMMVKRTIHVGWPRHVGAIVQVGGSQVTTAR